MGYDFHEAVSTTIDRQRCTVCGQCAAVCSTETLVVRDGQLGTATGNFMGCIACGQCMMACPTGAIAISGRRLAPADLVPLPPKEQQASAEQLDGLLVGRRSVRHFAEREVPRELVDRILATTATAPIGIPPSEVGIVVFHGRDKVRQFTADALAAYGQVLRFTRPWVLALMRPLLGRAQYAVMRDFVRPLFATILAEAEQGRDVFTYEAPLALLFHYRPKGDAADAHIAATYAMLAAESLGLGSCLLGTTVALARAKAFKEKYGIPLENKTDLSLVIGYPQHSFRHGIRRQLASIRFA